MRKNYVLLASAFAIFSGTVFVAACGDDGENEASTSACASCPYDYARFESDGTVSFASDVEPVLKRSCAFDACHSANRPKAGLNLGPKGVDWTDDDRTRVLASIVGVMGFTTQQMELIKPFEPENSFLMHKMDGCVGSLEQLTDCKAESTVHACGDTMPAGNDPLDCDERDLFRRWIKQGAKNN